MSNTVLWIYDLVVKNLLEKKAYFCNLSNRDLTALRSFHGIFLKNSEEDTVQCKQCGKTRNSLFDNKFVKVTCLPKRTFTNFFYLVRVILRFSSIFSVENNENSFQDFFDKNSSKQRFC